MSEMLERVARALCKSDGYNPDDVGGDFFDDGLIHWMAYQETARAAIEAMREPTADMDAAMKGASAPTGRDIYQLAIDAALA